MTACEKRVTQGSRRATILVKGPPGSGGLTGSSDQGTWGYILQGRPTHTCVLHRRHALDMSVLCPPS